MADTSKYKYRKSLTLTKLEGKKLEQLLKLKGLANVSQLVKQILKEGYIGVITP